MQKNLSQDIQFPDIANFKTNDRYFEEISPNIWLMDDHKWAYYIWEKIFSQNAHKAPFALFHLDYHWDGVNDFRESTHIKELVNIKEIGKIHNLVLEDYIRKDSFIASAIIRGLVDEVHFYCKQKDTEPGLDESLLAEYKASQFLHHDIDSLISYSTQKPIIFDIDLDLFNKSGMGKLRDILY
ncbi:MAG: UPF0489 family protein [Desulfobacteraceae bacterium]|nr:UPF0489 family protein [Desulfobacteraceae bacterium]